MSALKNRTCGQSSRDSEDLVIASLLTNPAKFLPIATRVQLFLKHFSYTPYQEAYALFNEHSDLVEISDSFQPWGVFTSCVESFASSEDLTKLRNFPLLTEKTFTDHTLKIIECYLNREMDEHFAKIAKVTENGAAEPKAKKLLLMECASLAEAHRNLVRHLLAQSYEDSSENHT